jgi:1-acyl-sn-glycerol-3-phosphate acyltransferase
MTGGPDREAPRAPASADPTDAPIPARPGSPAGSSAPPDGEAPAGTDREGDDPIPGPRLAADRRPGGSGRGGEDPIPVASPAAGPPRGHRPGDGADPTPPEAGRGARPGQRGTRPRGKNPEQGYRIAAVVVKPLMRTWFRIRLEGEEHIPEAGPVVLASNHRSNMDPVLLASAVRRPVAFMAKAELFVWPLGWILRWIGQFPVRRGGIDREALRRTDAILARGSVLGLFPEGTRGEGAFSAVHPGLAYIVVRQRCPVLPVAILGTERVKRRFGWLPFASPVRIVIGPAIDLPQSTSDRAGRRAASELFRQRLQAFLAEAGGAAPPATNRQSDE